MNTNVKAGVNMFIDKLNELWNIISRNISTFRVADAIDIAVVAILLYFVFKFIRDRRAGKLAAGIVTLILLLAVGNLVDMRVMSYLMQNVFQIGIIAIVIVFQPELRAVLEKVGGGSIKSVRSIGDFKNSDDGGMKLVCAVTDAAVDLSSTKTGALIVFERTTKLGDLVLTGTVIDSAVSEPLIKNIFFKNSPLHDGALIIRDDRLYAAGCLLPLSANQEISRDLGTRHRAALGMSENSDAVVLIISEETGTISIALDGEIKRGYSKETLTDELCSLLEINDKNTGLRSKLGHLKKPLGPKGASDKKKHSHDSSEN